MSSYGGGVPEEGFCNRDGFTQLGHWPWHEILRRNQRGDFRPRAQPAGGYEAFAQAWSQPVDLARLQQPSSAVQLSWLGHVTILLQVAGRNILMDPTLASHAGPWGRLGARREVPAPLQPAQLPRIDALLISHNHYDHLCGATLRALRACGQRPAVYAPMGLGPWFRRRGWADVTELLWWDCVELPPVSDTGSGEGAASVRLHFTPAQHWSRRTPWDTNRSLWGGFLVEWRRPQGAWRFHYPGDTGYSADFRAIRKRLGPVDLLALPIGAYLPRDFMRPQHVDPFDAVQLMLDLQAHQAFGVHWGTFGLTQEPLDQPLTDLAQALRERGLPPEQVWLLKAGETRAVPA